MSYLPDERPATKSDFAELRADVAGLREEFHTELRQFRAEIRDPDCFFRTLDDHSVGYVLVGGLAAVLHGSPTVTNDADICPNPHSDNFARLSGALIDLDARIRRDDDPPVSLSIPIPNRAGREPSVLRRT